MNSNRRHFLKTLAVSSAALALNPRAALLGSAATEIEKHPSPGSLDFVFEAYTLQALPEHVRALAATNVAAFVAPQGHLLVVARARDVSEPPGEMPWPLTRPEFSAFIEAGLAELSFEDYIDNHETPPARRFRAFYQRG